MIKRKGRLSKLSESLSEKFLSCIPSNIYTLQYVSAKDIVQHKLNEVFQNLNMHST